MKTLSTTKGSALLITLVLMFLLTTALLMTVSETSTDVELSFNQMHEEQAFYVAEAGAQKALSQLNKDNDWRDGFDQVTLGNGIYSVMLLDSTDNPALVDTVVARSTGEQHGARATVELTIAPIYKRPFMYGMFGESGISLDRSTCTDSYNSDSGSYAETVIDSMGDIGSNGTISSSKDVTFGGGITSATPGGITLGAQNTVNGDTTTAADSVHLDVVPDEEYVWAASNSNAPGGLSGAGYTYNSGTKSIVLGSYSSVTLSSGVYYFSSIELGQGSAIKLEPGADVTIYVTGDVTLHQGSSVNSGGDPSDFIIYSKGENLQFDQGNEFYGAFYGPNAHIQYDQTTQVYGSLVGNTLKLDQGACFHFDRNLMNIKKGKTGEMVATAWGENF